MMGKVLILSLIFFIFISFWMGFYISKSIANGYQRHAPSNYINKSQIHIYNNSICIDVENPRMSKYTNSGSMIPILDTNSNGIKIAPKNESEILVGDIITYKSEKDLIVHRVVKIGTDSDGWYFVAMGDNNYLPDGKLRWDNIKYKTIAIIY